MTFCLTRIPKAGLSLNMLAVRLGLDLGLENGLTCTSLDFIEKSAINRSFSDPRHTSGLVRLIPVGLINYGFDLSKLKA